MISLKIRTLILAGLIFVSASSAASVVNCVSLFPSSVESIPLLTEKVPTFPDIDSKAATAISYDRSVELPHAKNQCASGCSYNSGTAYLEAWSSFLRTGRTDSKGQPEYSANYLQTIRLLEEFDYSMSHLKRPQISGGNYPANNLLEAYENGVYLERDYPSEVRIDVLSLVKILNKRLRELDEIYPEREIPNAVADRNYEWAKALVYQTFGSLPSVEKLVHFVHFPNELEVYDYSLNSLLTFDLRAGKRVKLPVPREELLKTSEQKIREDLDRGLPVLLGYQHFDGHIDTKTGIFSVGEVTPNPPGHAVLIVGYRLNSKGEIEMLKILNSHSNASNLHMPIEYFRKFVTNVTRIKAP